jgi:hypothetical protein
MLVHIYVIAFGRDIGVAASMVLIIISVSNECLTTNGFFKVFVSGRQLKMCAIESIPLFHKRFKFYLIIKKAHNHLKHKSLHMFGLIVNVRTHCCAVLTARGRARGGTGGSGKTARSSLQGCQMVYFQTKNPNLGKFWRALEWKLLVYFMVIWNIHITAISYSK